MQRKHGFEQMHVRVLPAREFNARAAGRELLEEAAVQRIGEAMLHEVPGRVGELDHASVAGRAAIPGEREQHEGVVVGIARVVERRPFDRDGAKPAAVGRTCGPHQERKPMPRGLAEGGIATEQIGVAEHIGEARLHQRGAALACDRCAQRIEIFEEAAGRIMNAREPETADVIDQPGPQRGRIIGIEHHSIPPHAIRAFPNRVSMPGCGDLRQSRLRHR